jgi:hypothetical protein
MFRLYALLTHAFGSQRRFIRRIAGLCLVVMGVHLAADHLDDVVYRVLDALDLVVDETAASFFAWLAENGGMTPEAALNKSESFATWIDLAEKDKLAIVVALACELLLDLLLLDLAWGRHVDDDADGLFHELKNSARQIADALRPLDLERLAVLPALLCFAAGGAGMAALAVEGVARDLLQRFVPEFLWAGQAAAATGILAAVLLLWRFLPDLLHGALLRSRARHDAARARALQRLEAPHRHPRLARTTTLIRLGLRGLWLVVLVLPLALSGLASADVRALFDRIEVVPG